MLDINSLLLLSYHRLAKDVELILANIVSQGFVEQFIYLLHFGLQSETLLHKREGGFSLTETGHLHLCGDMLQFFLDGILIVCLLHFHGDDSTGACLLERNIHDFFSVICIVLFLIIFAVCLHAWRYAVRVGMCILTVQQGLLAEGRKRGAQCPPP